MQASTNLFRANRSTRLQPTAFDAFTALGIDIGLRVPHYNPHLAPEGGRRVGAR